MSLQASIGEEIFFRGALQPIFGSVLTALLFAVTHTQYAFTFTWVMVFLHGLCFAWLRRRYSTTAAIIAHAMYNFMPVVLILLLSSMPQ